jgi:hypothetical protein
VSFTSAAGADDAAAEVLGAGSDVAVAGALATVVAEGAGADVAPRGGASERSHAA